MRVAFAANLDVECELAEPERHRPSPRMVAGMAARAAPLQAQLAHCLAATVEVLVPGERRRARGPFAASLCWSPSPAALHLLRAAGAPLPAAPPLAVLQRVNHRAFCAGLAPQLPGARFVRSLAELDRILAPPRPPLGHLLKRPYGFAGRGRKHLPADAPLAGSVRTWAAASMHEYGTGLQVDPRVAVTADFALHGILDRAGGLLLGAATRQHLDASGAWQASVRATATDLSAPEQEELQETARRVGRALHAAGYFGPFGIDAYRYRDDAHAPRFHPLSEINARLTMGFAVGMGPACRALLALG